MGSCFELAGKRNLLAVLFKVGQQRFAPNGVALGGGGVEQIRHDTLFQNTVLVEEFLANIDPDGLFAVAKLGDFFVGFAPPHDNGGQNFFGLRILFREEHLPARASMFSCDYTGFFRDWNRRTGSRLASTIVVRVPVN